MAIVLGEEKTENPRVGVAEQPKSSHKNRILGNERNYLIQVCGIQMSLVFASLLVRLLFVGSWINPVDIALCIATFAMMHALVKGQPSKG